MRKILPLILSLLVIFQMIPVYAEDGITASEIETKVADEATGFVAEGAFREGTVFSVESDDNVYRLIFCASGEEYFPESVKLTVTDPVGTVTSNGEEIPVTKTDDGYEFELTDPEFTINEEAKTLEYSGPDYKVTAGPVSGDLELEVTEIDPDFEDYDRYLMDSTSAAEKTILSYSKILDIKLLEDGEEVEPDDPVSVTVTLDRSLENVEVVHFEGEKEEPVLIPSDVDGKDINFEAESFSAYAIVSGPDPADVDLVKVTDTSELTTGGFYISQTAGYFLQDTVYTVKGSRTGILKTTEPENAVRYYFEPLQNGKYYIFCYDSDDNRKYLKNSGNNSLSFSSSAVTEFSVEMVDGKFRIHNGDWYVNMQGGVNGKGFAAYNNATDVNSQLYIWSYDEPESDPYGLTTYGLMRYNSGPMGKALKDDFSAVAMQVMAKESDRTDRIYVPKGSDISMWTFEWVRKSEYNIKSRDKYLDIAEDGLSLSDTPTNITVCAGTGENEGKISLSSNGYTLCYSGTLDGGFTVTDSPDANSWLNLVEETEVTPDYLATYTADKVSISDTEKVPDGASVIIYTRRWNDRKKKYELFAVDHDGSLVPCTDNGDTIQWIGSAINTMLWDFTEYHREGTNIPNYYYELQNPYSGKYIAPQKTDGQVLSDEPIGINLNGRRYGEYYTTITAWDDPSYSYAALGVNNEELVSTSITSVSDFYFAIIKNTADDDMSTIKTLDNNEHGITMKLVDFNTPYSGNAPTSQEQHDVIGDSTGGANVPPNQGLLSNQLGENGYPTAVKTGRSLGDLYEGASTVNHLFSDSTYNATGYFEYDSTQNFASLKENGDFKVYNALGTSDAAGNKPSLKHGQFLPYNDLVADRFAVKNPENLYTAELNPLPETDPRKYERLYDIASPDHFFGLEVSASFVQTANGLDSWGHDIIYEFTGDDDFWLYVDGELVIDLGGIHSALPGSVNYSTGEVKVNGVKTTLYDIFKRNYKERNPNASESEVNEYLDGIFELKDSGKYLFRDYTTHDMKIFFMERGAGASNLHMKFNLASVKPGQIILSKQLSGMNDSDYRLADYGYQIWYQLEDGEPYYLLSDLDSHSRFTVKYQKSDTPVKFLRSYTPAGSSESYENVFFLNPTQAVAITVPDDTIRYKITEVGLNTQVYDEVKINDVVTEGIPAGTNRMDVSTTEARVYERQHVVFDNHVSENAERSLTITKKLVDDNGDEITDDDTGFNFRLYLGTENDDDPSAADTHNYHVKDPNGEYCVWNSAGQCFSPLGKTDFELLSAAEKEAATFQTSPNGAISKIPAGYKVEVRNLLVGTTFRVEEQTNEIPAGYKFLRYEREEDSYIQYGDEVNAGIIRDNESPAIEVINKRGYGLTVKKEWSDDTYMRSHDTVFFGILKDGVLLRDTIRPLTSKSLYWYFDDLELPLSHYDTAEVYLTGDYTVDGEHVTGDYEASAVDNGSPVPAGATDKNNVHHDYLYTVTYTKGTQKKNVRTDTAINSRHGIRLVKTDENGDPLGNAVFTITDPAGQKVGEDHYTSDAAGLITTAYINTDTVYTLTETASPSGYIASGPVKFVLDTDGTVTLTEGTARVTQATSSDMAVIYISNDPYEFRTVKTDQDGNPLGGAVFSLHKEVTTSGSSLMDFNPISGFENIPSSSDGTIPGVNESLPAGTYYLKEKTAPTGYEPVSTPVRFTITKTGSVTADENDNVCLKQTASGYRLEIKNKEFHPLPTGRDKRRFLVLIPVLLSAVVLVRKKAKR